MSVRQTESRLPTGCSAFDLGQAVQTEDGKYALVSFLSSPIVRGTTNHYVVFALNGSPADRYHWTFESIPSGLKETSDPDPDIGIYEYVPPENGTLRVDVQILVEGSPQATLSMPHEISEADSNLEVLINSENGAFGGNPEASRELVNNFKRFILDAVYVAGIDIPEALLASIVYAESMMYSNSSLLDLFPFIDRETRFKALEKAADHVNQSGENVSRGAYHTNLGVCQLTPCQAAMIFSNPSSPQGESYIQMVEQPPNRRLEEISAELEGSFDQLEDDLQAGAFRNLKTDLFNVLRFPRSNIRTCAEYILKLKNRQIRWPHLGRNEFLSDIQAIEVIAAEFKAFPNTASVPADSTTESQALLGTKGKVISGLLYHPVIYNHFRRIFRIEGRVVEEEGGTGIEDARIDLCRTVINITHAPLLRCFTEPDPSSPKLIFGGREVTIRQGEKRSVLEFRPNHPTPDFDWARIDTGVGWGWINVRSGEQWYASQVYDERKMEGIARTNGNGEFALGVKREDLHKLRAVKFGYFDGESERLRAPITDAIFQMRRCENNIREADIIKRLSHFAGYGYDFSDPRYPYKLADWMKNEVLESATAKRNNCSFFTETILVRAWQKDLPEWKDQNGNIVVWDSEKHCGWMIKPAEEENGGPDHRFSPIEVAVSAGMAVDPVYLENGNPDHESIVPHSWSLAQGFKYAKTSVKWAKGHSFIIVAMHPETRRVLTLESNAQEVGGVWVKYLKLLGPGFRQIGHIDDVDNYTPEAPWWLQKDLVTWEDIKISYPYMMIARLRVFDLKWV